MTWRKLGIVYCPDESNSNWKSHASTPTVEVVGENRVRVYYSSRDSENRSSIFCLELKLIGDSFELIHVGEEPVLQPGGAGLFDDSGVSIGSMVYNGNDCYLYYVGWNLGVTVPWRNTIGLAIRREREETFEKYSSAPILDRSAEDPYSLSYPWVMKEGERSWRMFYGSNLSWGDSLNEMEHVIKQCVSSDGIHWERNEEMIFPPSDKGGTMMARPCLMENSGLYRMWYSWRGDNYQIGYAESVDLNHWERKDAEVGIEASADGWDSDSVEYPCVFDLGGCQYMLYNGNGYGKTGFGIAIID
tara:strand:- start:8149 stop:9054 length:906 start_codon:yes stop_codon:yes gene_type:complete